MAKITLIFPFIGEINTFHSLALIQLSKIKCLNVIVITAENTNSHARNTCKGVEFLSIDRVFKHDNKYKISLDDIFKHPYKLCDYRPFFDKIFKFSHEQFWGFGDLDCIYNPERLEYLFTEIHDSNGIYGELGHLRIVGTDAISTLQKRLLTEIEKYKNRGIDLFNPKKGYAIDEHRFFNVLCEELHSEKKITWHKDYFKPIWDVDYKHIIPNNILVTKITFTQNGIYESNGEPSKLSYIHLQKRKIYTHLDNLNGALSFHFCEKTGHVCFTKDNNKVHYRPSIKNKTRFFLAVLIGRVKYRIYNYGFSKRPSLICKK